LNQGTFDDLLPRRENLGKASQGIFHNIRKIGYTCTAECSFKTRPVNRPYYELTPFTQQFGEEKHRTGSM